jgi:hypothetical protein
VRALRWAIPLALLAVVAACLQARSYDLWWHLEAGEWIASMRAVPRVDDFSFTSRGALWIDHEWLFQLVLHAMHAVFGLHALTLVKALAAFGAAIIGFLGARRVAGDRVSASGALALAAFGMVGMRPRLAERPEILAFPFAALAALCLLDLAARPHKPAPRLAGLAALTALWANLHASALLAPVLGAAVVAGSLLDVWRGQDRPRARHAVKSAATGTVLCSLALALNPYGARIYEVPLHLSKALALTNLVNPEWQAPSWRDFPLFHVMAAAMAALALVRLARGTPLAGPLAAIAAVTVALGFASIRHIGIFFALLPMMAAPWRPTARPGEWSGVWGVGACVVAGVWMIVSPPAGSRIGLGLQPGRFPVAAADFVDARLPDARLYNDVASGGYLIWRGYPQRRVFLDGRNEVHAALMRDLSGALDDGAAWQGLLDRHQVDGALVLYRPGRVAYRDASTGALAESSWSELHFPWSRWALVHWDDMAMIFVKRDGKYAPLAAASEYLSVRPEAFRLGLGGARPDAPAGGVARELGRRLSEDPGSRLANEMATVYGSGDPPGR